MTSHATRARATYDRIAPLYDLMDGPYEVLWKRRLRTDVFIGLRGRILDAGVGTGCNMVAYPAGAQVTAVDASAAMLARAQIRASRVGRNDIDFACMDLTDLSCPDATFDAIVSTFVFMCIPDSQLLPALREVRRVCKPDGEIRLLDYCLSRRPLVRFGMKMMAPWLRFTFAGTYEPATATYFEAAGLRLLEERLVFGDAVKLLRLRPA